MPQLYSTPLAHIAEMNLCFVALRSELARVAHTTGANGIGLLVYQFYGCLVPRLYHDALAKGTPAGREPEKNPNIGCPVVSMPRLGGLHHRYGLAA